MTTNTFRLLDAGLRIYPTKRFYYQGHPYQISLRGAELVGELWTIVRQANAGAEVHWLARHREDLRRGIQDRHLAVLAYVIEESRSADLRRLAIWLLGRCRSTFGTMAVARQCSDRNPKIRREAARALRRMQGWAHLRRMRECDGDPRVVRLATMPPPKPHPARLRAFLAHVRPEKVAAHAPEFWLTEHHDGRRGLPPKRGQFIRRVLERIHMLVRGFSGPQRRLAPAKTRLR